MELIERLELFIHDVAEHGLHQKAGEGVPAAEKRLKARARNTLIFHHARKERR